MNSKFLLLLLFIAFSYNSSLAQRFQPDERNGYIALSVGSAIPVGGFGNKTFAYGTLGFAQSGVAFDFTFNYLLSERIGIVGMVRGQSNPIDETSIKEEFQRLLETQTAGATPFLDATAEEWAAGSLLAGIFSSTPLNDEASIVFETKGMIGFMGVSSPGITVSANPPLSDPFSEPTNYYATLQSGSAISFCYLLGAGVRFNIGQQQKFAILINGDILSANPHFRGQKVTSSESEDEQVYNFDQMVQNFNLSMGLAYRLK